MDLRNEQKPSLVKWEHTGSKKLIKYFILIKIYIVLEWQTGKK